MKKRYKQYAGPQLAAYGLLLALLLSGLPHIDAYAEDVAADSPFIELKEDKIKRNEPMESDTTRETISRVGPSGQDIHDFLYPMPKVDEAVTPDN
jgi:hypothetical protein